MNDSSHVVSETVDVLWQSSLLTGLEHFSYRQEPRSRSLEGTVVLPRNGIPTTIHYVVRTNDEWEARTCRFMVTDPNGGKLVEISADGHRWCVDGEERTDLAGCTDIDLGWTPSTNTLPMRRTGLAAGGSTTIRAAWVTFPDLVVRPSRQRYTRTGHLTWTYQSGDFTAELVTDELGFVIRYGSELWSAVASSRDHGD